MLLNQTRQSIWALWLQGCYIIRISKFWKPLSAINVTHPDKSNTFCILIAGLLHCQDLLSWLLFLPFSPMRATGITSKPDMKSLLGSCHISIYIAAQPSFLNGLCFRYHLSDKQVTTCFIAGLWHHQDLLSWSLFLPFSPMMVTGITSTPELVASSCSLSPK